MTPPRSVLAAVDFSDGSRLALQLAARLAKRCDAKLHILHVEDPMLVAAGSQSGIDVIATTREELAHLVASLEDVRELTPHLDVVMAEASKGILHIAAREHADLIVAGAHGLSGPARLLFGSVTHQLLVDSTRSVLVVPDTWQPPADTGDPGLGPIVVGIDECEPSLIAAQAACALATVLQTRVEAVHVVPELSVLTRWQPQAEEIMRERVELARRDLTRLVATATPAIDSVRVVRGDIAEQLALAAQADGDRQPLLVLGRRNRPNAEGAPGATAQRVATLAKVPVLMHREPRT